METAQPPLLSPTPAPVAAQTGSPPNRRYTATLKLVFIAALVLLLQLPLKLINDLRQDRIQYKALGTAHRVEAGSDWEGRVYSPAEAAAEGYRMVERSLKHSVLVLTLVFAAFFLFEVLAGLRLHPVHYGLVGGALCLFYLALLALGEVFPPKWAYLGAALASSLLITLYSISILHSYARASTIAVLLLVEHSVLYVVLRMENFALLAGTAALFVALGALMYFTRRIDWFAQDTAIKEAART